MAIENATYTELLQLSRETNDLLTRKNDELAQEVDTLREERLALEEEKEELQRKNLELQEAAEKARKLLTECHERIKDLEEEGKIAKLSQSKNDLLNKVLREQAVLRPGKMVTSTDLEHIKEYIVTKDTEYKDPRKSLSSEVWSKSLLGSIGSVTLGKEKGKSND